MRILKYSNKLRKHVEKVEENHIKIKRFEIQSKEGRNAESPIKIDSPNDKAWSTVTNAGFITGCTAGASQCCGCYQNMRCLKKGKVFVLRESRLDSTRSQCAINCNGNPCLQSGPDCLDIGAFHICAVWSLALPNAMNKCCSRIISWVREISVQ
jgi:hypothetical protein